MAILHISTREQFEHWLCANSDFADARVLSFSPDPKSASSSLPSKVMIDLAYQTKGNYEANSTRISRVFRVHASGISEYCLAAEGIVSSEHWSEGMEILESDSPISFQIDVPALLTVCCCEITVEELPELTEIVSPWFSDREVFAFIPSSPMPTPAQWQTIFSGLDQDVVWHIYYGPPKNSEEVPASNYEGWFLQNREDLDETHQGIFFFACKPVGNGFRLQIQNNGASHYLWQAAMTVLAAFDSVEIHCGNCKLAGADFLSEWTKWNKAQQSGAGQAPDTALPKSNAYLLG